jgi:predicted CXXCH cytochrome family protein
VSELYSKARFAFMVALLASVSLFAQSAPEKPRQLEAYGYVGNDVCARCHAPIFNSYKQTPMAHASGPAEQDLIPGDFVHEKSGVKYRIYKEAGRVWMSFERRGDPAISGRKELLFFIGSGRRGRGYLFAVDGFLFESPVNWYADEKVWDMTPAYHNTTQIPLNLPANMSCLQCHVSGAQPPMKGTENRYAEPISFDSGVICERCHGPGKLHVRGGAIVNPSRLTPVQRDSICMECHLEGRVSIERAGRHAYDFRPGDVLSDYVRHYLLTSRAGNNLGAVSQVEALAQSKCKRASGDAMSCTSCHDPHRSPSAEEREAYFRQKCMACHKGMLNVDKHHPEQPDCTRCHMPALTSDIAHTQVTDHRIPRRPQAAQQNQLNANRQESTPTLIPFPDTTEAQHDVRDLALAWGVLAEQGMKTAVPEAERLLHAALLDTPNDPAILATLGFIEQKRGAIDHAAELYKRALQVDPNLVDAAANLAVIEANRGLLREPALLWQSAFERAPAKSHIGIDAARILCEARKFDSARSIVQRVLRFNPDLPSARGLAKQLDKIPPACTRE